MKLALQGCSWYSISFLNPTFPKICFLQHASPHPASQDFMPKTLRKAPNIRLCIHSLILKMRLLDLSLRVKVEVTTIFNVKMVDTAIFTLPFKNCISNTQMWSIQTKNLGILEEESGKHLMIPGGTWRAFSISIKHPKSCPRISVHPESNQLFFFFNY